MVVRYSTGRANYPGSHEAATQTLLAKQLARLKGLEYGGEYDPARQYDQPLYFVPSEVLVGAAMAHGLGIHSTDDLFGGVVPFAFVATKAISHPLVSTDAAAPEGWSPEFHDRVRDVVLFGYSAFSFDDAREAARNVLARGPARIKRARGIGGRGQAVISRLDDLDGVLASLDPAELRDAGVVIETNCDDTMTMSVGQIQVAGLVAAYCGVQKITTDNHGNEVYGGSDLFVVRGGFETLRSALRDSRAIDALDQATQYDSAARETFPDLLVSRRNYDVMEGIDGSRCRQSGVLEQSWRIGGATGAELAALEAFQRDPEVTAVRASTTELYGERPIVPTGVTIYFRGDDPRIGPLTKFAALDAHVQS